MTSTEPIETNKNEKTKTSKGETTNTSLSIKGIPEFAQLPPKDKREKFLFMASVKAPYYRDEKRANLDLICVLDESSSMSGDRIRLLKETTEFVAKNLESGDRLGLVGYNDSAHTILELTKMDSKGKEIALKAIKAVRATGSTALCDGLLLGIKMMRERKESNPVASIMLLTDGEANIGLTNARDIIKAMKDPNYKINESRGGYNNNYNNYNNFNMYQQQPRPMKKFKNKRNKRSQPPQPPQQQQQSQGLFGSIKNYFSGSSNTNNSSNIQQIQGVPSPQPQIQIQQPIQQQQIQQQPMIQQQMQGPPPTLSQPPQPPMIQQQQQVISPPVPVLTPTEGETEGKETEKEKETKGGEVSSELPCTVNTFGFGKNHNSSLLEAISESGRGMYAFVENTDVIAETFAECLGGLVSTVAKELKIKVESLNGTKINKCLSVGFNMKSLKPNEVYEISIPDMQSEESRDLVFELSVPSIKDGSEEWKLTQLTLEYINLIQNDKNETITIFSTLNRSSNIKETGERDYSLDLQHNRLLAAEAMERADELGNKNKLEEARKILKEAEKTINVSRTNKDVYSQNLVKDMQRCAQGLQSTHSYNSTGSKMLKMNKKANYMQRSCQSNVFQSQMAYQSTAKSSMMNKFKR